jgi:hypothetical protein
MDSLAGRPVSDARVSLAGPSGNEAAYTYADARGWFLLRAPDSGHYRLVAVAVGYRRSAFPPFDLPSDQMLSYILLLPSVAADPGAPDAATEALAARHCGDIGGGSPVVVGTVRDAASGEPASGATVFFSTPGSPDTISADSSPDGSFGTTTTESDGTYALCDLPAMSRISLHVSADDRASSFEPVLFGTAGVFADEVFHDLTQPIWRQDFELLPATLRTGSVTGIVTDTAGSPMNSAIVEIVGSEYRTRSDGGGRFTLPGLTRGSVRLRARQVGYSPVEFDTELLPAAALHLPEDALVLVRAPVRLRDIVVGGDPLRANPRLAGFFYRRENSPRGKFVTEVEWQTRLHFDVTDITSRLRYSLERSHICDAPTSYFLDGVYMYLPPDVSVNDIAGTDYLAAVEAYGNGFDAPTRYRRHGCGSVILLWTH